MWGGLNKVATAQIREIVREELRSELQRIVNPTFLHVIQAGVDDLERISDAVADADRKYDDLVISLKVLEKTVEKMSGEKKKR